LEEKNIRFAVGSKKKHGIDYDNLFADINKAPADDGGWHSGVSSMVMDDDAPAAAALQPLAGIWQQSPNSICRTGTLKNTHSVGLLVTKLSASHATSFGIP
jgi:hypothetical protein